MSASVSSSQLRMQEGITPLGGLSLHHGGHLDDARIAWRLSGRVGAPMVVALGGISAHRQTHGEDERSRGWWQGVVGAGCALDTERLQILSFDYLGGSGNSSAPSLHSSWPALSPYDQAEGLAQLMQALGIERVRAIVGASYGGMVALAFAERYPDQVTELAIVSAADHTHPMATAWRSVQRNWVRFALRHGAEGEGLQLARALAMSTYRSAAEFAQRFTSEPTFKDGVVQFPVEEYLLSRGQSFAEHYSAASFLCLSESIDLHRVDAGRITVPTRALGVVEDQLVPITDMRRLCATLPKAELLEISSLYGHDAFLKEYDILRDWLQPLRGDLL